jgi:molybdate transport system substrate-binding protein
MVGNCDTPTVVFVFLTLALLALLVTAAQVSARASSAQLKIMISGGFRAAYQELVPEFEHKTGYTIVTVSGPSMGNTPDAIPNRLRRNEPAYVVILDASSLAELIRQHKVIAGTRVDLASSVIALAVRAGARKPDISSLEAFKHTLLTAKSIAYSDGVSGIYRSTEVFQRLGVADAIRSK